MKAIFSLRRHGYLKTVGVFLIALALIAGVVGCEGEPAPTYTLATEENPAGAGTATDQTGTSPYEEGEIIDIEAVAADCYQFVNWQASAGTFGDANNATTTFTMPASDITVTANFEPVPPDHYKLYWADWEEVPPDTLPVDVMLEDQFGTFNATVGEVYWFGNPVEKVHGDTTTPISDWDRHYTFYYLDFDEDWMTSSFQVTVNNQFQHDVELTVHGPTFLGVPTRKEDQEMPECLDHLLGYEIVLSGEPEPIAEVDLHDQFYDEQGVTVYEPVLFANPVKKTVLPGGSATPIEHEDEHYVFYPIDGESFVPSIQIDNQFGEQTLDLFNPELLAVPSQKISWEQPLGHFKCYDAMGAPIDETVQLVDQFGSINATVGEPVAFANPVNKWHGVTYTPISNPNNHLTFYSLYYEGTPPEWYVQVTNQFGIDQPLRVTGPMYVGVPTKKWILGPPENLDHFLLYAVLDSGKYPTTVYLQDQFTSVETSVGYPIYFANPAEKIHGSVVTPIKNPDDHLVFYVIDGGTFSTEGMPITTQFGPQELDIWASDSDLLAVPSLKVEWSVVPP